MSQPIDIIKSSHSRREPTKEYTDGGVALRPPVKEAEWIVHFQKRHPQIRNYGAVQRYLADCTTLDAVRDALQGYEISATELSRLTVEGQMHQYSQPVPLDSVFWKSKIVNGFDLLAEGLGHTENPREPGHSRVDFHVKKNGVPKIGHNFNLQVVSYSTVGKPREGTVNR